MIDRNQQPKKRPLRLLIVDDSTAARSGLKALLETVAINERDLEIFEAANGQEALQYIETVLPDVILMDVQMPLVNGIEATRLIKEQWPTTKVVILTMYADYQSQALAAGADAVLLKGYSSEELISAVYR